MIALQERLEGVRQTETLTMEQARKVVDDARSALRVELRDAAEKLRSESAEVNLDLDKILLHHYGERLAEDGERIVPVFKRLEADIKARAAEGGELGVPMLITYPHLMDGEDCIKEQRSCFFWIERDATKDPLFRSEVRVTPKLMHAFTGKEAPVRTATLTLLARAMSIRGELHDHAPALNDPQDSFVLSRIEEALDPRQGFSMSSYGFSNSSYSTIIPEEEERADLLPTIAVGWEAIENEGLSNYSRWEYFLKNLQKVVEKFDIDSISSHRLPRHLRAVTKLENDRQELERSSYAKRGKVEGARAAIHSNEGQSFEDHEFTSPFASRGKPS